MGYHYTTSSFTVSTVGVSRKQRSYCIISSETPEYRMPCWCWDFRSRSLFFESWKLQVAGDLGGWSRSWLSPHCHDRESLDLVCLSLIPPLARQYYSICS